MKYRIRSLLVVAALAAAAPALARAQVVVATTFGPGDSYNTGFSYVVDPSEAIAEGFMYGLGSSAALDRIRVALLQSADPYTVSFLEGSNILTATTLESFSQTASLSGIYALSSVLQPSLVPGDTYWVQVANAGSGGWFFNDQGYLGVWAGIPNFAWADIPNDASTAYDVSVAGTVTPEPATLLLLATGLLGVAGAAVRRRRPHEG